MITARESETEAASVSAITKIVVIDNQCSYVDAFGLALELTSDLRVVAHESKLEEGLDLIRRVEPDLIVTASLPRNTFDGLHMVSDLGQTGSRSVPLVFLTAYANHSLVVAAKEDGNVSVISKHLPVADIVNGLRSIAAGEQIFLGIASDPFNLSPAELEVLEFLIRGQSAARIADDMQLTIHAIRARIRSLLAKTSSRSQLEAVTKAITAGIVAPPPVDAPF